MATITFGEKTYQTDDLNDTARRCYNAIRYADDKLQDLKQQMDLLKTAAVSYSQAIASQLPEQAHPNKKKGVITVNDKKYEYDKFADQAKQQITSLTQADRRIEDAKIEIALIEAARHSFVQTLQQNLPTQAA